MPVASCMRHAGCRAPRWLPGCSASAPPAASTSIASRWSVKPNVSATAAAAAPPPSTSPPHGGGEGGGGRWGGGFFRGGGGGGCDWRGIFIGGGGRSSMDVQNIRAVADGIRDEVRKAVVGQDEVMALMLTGLLVGGHILLEGVPGTAKTLITRAFAAALTLQFGRFQFTP